MRLIYTVKQANSDGYRRFRLIRRRDPDTDAGPYYDGSIPDWWVSTWRPDSRNPDITAVIVDNVAAFRLHQPHSVQGYGPESFGSILYSNQLPEYVDVVLDVLSEKNARKADTLAPGDYEEANENSNDAQMAFVQQNSRRYTMRVYFHNSHGYDERL